MTMQRTLTLVTLLCNLSMLNSRRLCDETRTSGGHSNNTRESVSYVKADCRSRELLRVPTYLSNNVTQLDLGGNKLSLIRKDDFVNIRYLRVLILSNNSISSLECRCFLHLRYLERLDLRNNEITSFTRDTFVGLESLRVLLLSGLPLTSYPTEFVSYTRELRVLSLSAIGDATIPAEYTRLSRLETLELNKCRWYLRKITTAMLDGIRTSNITTLSIRNMRDVQEIEAGAFSHMSNLRSLILACNDHLSFDAKVAALATTTNTSVENVVLDGTSPAVSVFNESAFCSGFWRRIRRLSVRKNKFSTMSFNYVGCLKELRAFVMDYNSPTDLSPSFMSPSKAFPNVQLFSYSHMTTQSYDENYESLYCHSRQDRFSVDDYFPAPPAALSKLQEQTPRNPCGEDFVNILFPHSLEYLYLVDLSFKLRGGELGDYCLSNIRFLNVSYNKFTLPPCVTCHVVGRSRLEIFDISHGKLQHIIGYMSEYPRLRFFNLSHNNLGVSGSDFGETFIHLIRLEDINLSHNKLRSISPVAFQRCTRLRRLNLANNELTQFDLNIRRMTMLEYIDVSENRLFRLSGIFTSKLDELFQRRPLEVNLQGDTLTCNCESVSFVRWIRTTQVRLTDLDKLTCLHGSDRHMLLTAIPMGEFETGCDVADNELAVFGLIIFGIVICVIVLSIVRYHRWYIKYHVTLCWRQGQGATCHEYNHDALVLYFIHAFNSRDQEGGVARISRWVCTRLLPRAEDEWGLRLYVGDRDDLGGASKIHNFVRGFQSSDKVVVCLTREFIDDSDCMNYLATALDSSKPLSKYIFVLFDDIQPTSVPRRLRQLLLPDSPSIQITWDGVEDGDESAHDTFWRRMRDTLLNDPDQERCRRRFDTIPLLVSIHDNNMS
ncbi:hypothetical protein NP493_1365g00041 [Ridgeia piscesae]|uniref:TIR domain-containing protein n=1 Tax=Ridgeia piscesae TaxID=27915 RepID=A0AAD9K7G7_RIDPI|nr:hypothetical protein NP493_1365g00041 [Ridgeia piscesae]